MNRKKHKIGKVFVLVVMLCLGVFLSACTSVESAQPSQKTEGESKLQIVTTIFPEYDWVREVLGELSSEAEIEMLLDNGVDLHSYQPTVDDILKISNCDLLIYVGGESSQWIEDALKETENPNRKVICLLDELEEEVKEEEIVEGMEEENEEHTHLGHEEDSDAIVEYDEHVWLSLRNAERICQLIAQSLGELTPDYAEQYQEHAQSYIEQLKNLDSAYQSAVDEASKKTLLFGDRFPFRYLTEDYGLSYYAAFPGCSTETDASFETVLFLAGKMDELDLDVILTVEKSNQKMAKTIVENTKKKGQKILTLNSMQSVSSKEMEEGNTYLSIMEQNLEVLKETLR